MCFSPGRHSLLFADLQDYELTLRWLWPTVLIGTLEASEEASAFLPGGFPILVRAIRTFTAASAVLLFVTTAAAQTEPFSFSVESFSIPERGVFDGFDDGQLDGEWSDGIRGSVLESGSTLTLSNPGEFGFLPAPLVNEVSGVSGQGLQLDFGGSFTATSVWTQQVPTLGQAMNFSLGSLNSSTNHIHQVSIGLSDTLPSVVSVLGGSEGLGVSVLSVIRDSQAGDILSLSRITIPILSTDISGEIHLALFFDDVTNMLQPSYSTDGSATLLSAGSAIPWNFFGGGFALTSSSTVPEPGTALLLGFGLALMSRRERGASRATVA